MMDFRIKPLTHLPFVKKTDDIEKNAEGKNAEKIEGARHFVTEKSNRNAHHGQWGYMDTVTMRDGKVTREHRDLTSAQAAQLTQALELQTALLHHKLFETLQRMDEPWGCLEHDRFDRRPHDVKVR